MNLITLSRRVLLAGSVALMAACGGGGSADAPPPNEGGTTPPVVTPVAPTITLQPASATILVGATNTFTVAATGTAPLAYQWQRNGVAITGATGTSYTTPAATLADSGTTFRAVVTNVAGSATSDNATLTVNPATTPPVVTVTTQPLNTSATAGASASFSVAATCSSGTLTVQWQRASGGAFTDIAGATATTYTFMTVAGDNGAQFRANLSCGGQSPTTSSVVTLTISMPSAVTLRYLNEKTRPSAIIEPSSIVREASGSYVFYNGNNIKRLAADQQSITWVTGAEHSGRGYVDGAPDVALFGFSVSLVEDATGVIYAADSDNQTIRKIALDGTVSTIAGTKGSGAYADGAGPAASFNSPSGMALGPDGALYLADINFHRIRKVTTDGTVTTYAGDGTQGLVNGAAAAARFSYPNAVAVAANGDVYVADLANSVIRKIARDGNGAGVVTTIAGGAPYDVNGTAAPVNGIGSAAAIPGPSRLAINGNTLYVLDSSGQIRAVDLTTFAVTTFAGTAGQHGAYVDGLPGHAALADVYSVGMAPTPDGGLMIGDISTLRSIDSSGRMKTIATARSNPTGDTSVTQIGVLSQMPFYVITGVNTPSTIFTVDAAGTLVVDDGTADSVRRIDTSGNVTLVAGLQGSSAGVVDGVRNEAVFNFTGGAIATAPDGTIYTADYYGVRKILPDGTTTFLTGSTSIIGYVDGAASVARFNYPSGMAFLPNGDLLVSDAGNWTIRRVNTTTGATSTYAGDPSRKNIVDGPVASAGFRFPGRLAAAPDGSIWTVDQGNLRHITTDGVISTLNPGMLVGALAIDPDGTIYFGAAGGLYSIPGTSAGTVTPTLLIPAGDDVTVSPDTPTTGGIAQMAVLGHKQIAMRAGSLFRFVIATLP